MKLSCDMSGLLRRDFFGGGGWGVCKFSARQRQRQLDDDTVLIRSPHYSPTNLNV